MRFGFTTGSCAAAAAKAAAYMLLTGKEKHEILIETPKGIPFQAEILFPERTENQVSCAVRKDGGDDPDITTGTLIYATVSFLQQGKETTEPKKETAASGEQEDFFPKKAEQKQESEKETQILIDGGTGVGRVTKPGLDQPVGNAAINHVPRQMIEKEVREICNLTDYSGDLSVVISVPGGEELAKKTFNPRLGIVGGISIIGTSGIVEPMSSQALLDTIRVALRQKKAEGYTIAAVSPGNYGLEFMQQTYQYDLDKSVKCSNFIGATIDMAAELGFQKMLLTGHIGKLVKVAGGIMNTHSKEGDCRMELLAASAVRAHVPIETIEEVLSCVTTEAAIEKLQQTGKLEAVMADLLERIYGNLKKRGAGKAIAENPNTGERETKDLQVEVIVYAKEYGELAKSRQAEAFLRELL